MTFRRLLSKKTATMSPTVPTARPRTKTRLIFRRLRLRLTRSRLKKSPMTLPPKLPLKQRLPRKRLRKRLPRKPTKPTKQQSPRKSRALVSVSLNSLFRGRATPQERFSVSLFSLSLLSFLSALSHISAYISATALLTNQTKAMPRNYLTKPTPPPVRTVFLTSTAPFTPQTTISSVG